MLAEGLELYLNRSRSDRFGWWVSYALSSVEEELEGTVQPRSNDQTHALTASASYRPNRKWDLTAVWTFHTGWPTTAVSGSVALVPGQRDELVYDVGPFYGERLPSYHRLDLRVSRTTELSRGQLTFFIDVQNLYDRENPRGIDIDDPVYTQVAPGQWTASFPQQDWLGLMSPSGSVGSSSVQSASLAAEQAGSPPGPGEGMTRGRSRS